MKRAIQFALMLVLISCGRGKTLTTTSTYINPGGMPPDSPGSTTPGATPTPTPGADCLTSSCPPSSTLPSGTLLPPPGSGVQIAAFQGGVLAPNPVAYYSTVNVQWSSTNTASCSVSVTSQGVTSAFASGLGGSQSSVALVFPTSYKVTCQVLESAATVSAEVFINVDCPASDAVVNATIGGRLRPLAYTCNTADGPNCESLASGGNGNNNTTALLTLKPGYFLKTGNYSGTITWGGASGNTSACPNGPGSGNPSNGQYAGEPYLIPLLQFKNSTGDVLLPELPMGQFNEAGNSPPYSSVGTLRVRAAKLTDFSTAKAPPVGATTVWGSFPDGDYSDNSGSCSFELQQVPLCRLTP